jgi:hypothetical protein
MPAHPAGIFIGLRFFRYGRAADSKIVMGEIFPQGQLGGLTLLYNQ